MEKFTCTVIAAMSFGVIVGLVASSVTNFHVIGAQTQAAVPVVPVAASRVNNVQTLGGYPVSRMTPKAVQGEHDIPASFSWASITALAPVGAVLGAALLAMRRHATNVYETIWDDPEAVLAGAGRAMGAAVIGAAIASSANAASLTYDELQSLSYLEVKGSGIAGTCPVVDEGTTGTLNLKAGKYEINNMCLEPSSFQVRLPPSEKQPLPQFEKTRLLTRLTYTLDAIRADLTVGSDGSWTIQERDGLDYSATTVRLPGGEPVPFLFTIKNMLAKGDAGQFLGQFDVPSYRGGTFMDPKGRGGSTGYDTAVALPASGDDEEYMRENIKRVGPAVGTIAFKVAKVNAETGEIAGVFESLQRTDDDMGAKPSKDLKTSGVWYAQISPSQ